MMSKENIVYSKEIHNKSTYKLDIAQSIEKITKKNLSKKNKTPDKDNQTTVLIFSDGNKVCEKEISIVTSTSRSSLTKEKFHLELERMGKKEIEFQVFEGIKNNNSVSKSTLSLQDFLAKNIETYDDYLNLVSEKNEQEYQVKISVERSELDGTEDKLSGYFNEEVGIDLNNEFIVNNTKEIKRSDKSEHAEYNFSGLQSEHGKDKRSGVNKAKDDEDSLKSLSNKNEWEYFDLDRATMPPTIPIVIQSEGENDALGEIVSGSNNE